MAKWANEKEIDNDIITLVFSNADADTPKNVKIRCDRESVAYVMAWYGAYFAGDRYTVTANGHNVRMDQNGVPTMVEYSKVDTSTEAVEALRALLIAADGESYAGYSAAIETATAAAIREAALREAIQSLREWQDDLNRHKMTETALTVGMAADAVFALIPTKGAADDQ